MKTNRIVSMVLALALLLSLAALPAAAESTLSADSTFTLRNGIRFGMKQDEVKALETWTPVTGFHLFGYTGQLIGADSLVRYYYSESDGGLEAVLYAVGTVYGEDGKTIYAANDLAIQLYNGLVMKYGTKMIDYLKALAAADPDTSVSVEPIENPMLSMYILYLKSAAGGEGVDFEAISENNKMTFVIPDGSQNVNIDLQTYKVQQNGETRYLTLLCYSRLSEETRRMVETYMNDL